MREKSFEKLGRVFGTDNGCNNPILSNIWDDSDDIEVEESYKDDEWERDDDSGLDEENEEILEGSGSGKRGENTRARKFSLKYMSPCCSSLHTHLLMMKDTIK